MSLSSLRCSLFLFGSVLTPLPAALAQASLPVNSTVSIRLVDPLDSGSKRNGDAVHALLAAPVKTSSGAVLPAGAQAMATVVSSAKAGEIQSAGVLSLQLTQVAGVHVISDVIDFTGHEGHKDVADAAPAKGTEASVKAGAILRFKVLENGHATGLDLADAARAKAEGTVGAPAPGNSAAKQPAPTSTGSPNTQPASGQTAIPGATTPH